MQGTWNNIGLTNALDDDVANLIAGFTRRPRVIALGQEAGRGLTAAGVGYDVIMHHPQYRRRFLRTRRSEYVNQLIEAVVS
jgi:hypothetical protein